LSCTREVEVKDVEGLEGLESVAKFGESPWIKINMGSRIKIEFSEFRIFDQLGVFEGFKNKGMSLIS